MRQFLVLISLLLSTALLVRSEAQASEGARQALVFFTAESSTVDKDAAKIVQRIAQVAHAAPTAPVHVLGFAAPDTGTPESNKQLAQDRAQHVADALVAAGISLDRIRIESRGSFPFQQVATGSRRVEIVVGE